MNRQKDTDEYAKRKSNTPTKKIETDRLRRSIPNMDINRLTTKKKVERQRK